MRTAEVCPTCSTYINARCVIYDGPNLMTLKIPTLSTMHSAMLAIEEWAQNNGVSSDGDLNYTFISQVDVGGVETGQTVGPTIKDALDILFSAPDVALTLTYNISPTFAEKGTTSLLSGNWNINLNTDTITAIQTNQGGNITSQNPSTLNGTQVYSPVTFASGADKTTSITVVSSLGGSTTISRTINFYAPSYVGVMDIADTNSSANIIASTTKLIKSKSNLAHSFSPVNERYVYAYPASYGDLSMIRDENNFDVTSSFVKTVMNFLLLDGSTESMNVYVSDSNTTQTNFNNTFIF